AADAGPPCRFEEGDAAIQIAAAERGRILPLATTIFARHMVKGCMNKEISALEQAAGKLAAKFIWLEPDRHRKEVSGWLGTAKDNNRMTGSEKTFDDEASHITRATGNHGPGHGSGFFSRSGSGMFSPV